MRLKPLGILLLLMSVAGRMATAALPDRTKDGEAGGNDWALRHEVPGAVGQLSFTGRWNPEAGLKFRLGRRDDERFVHLALGRTEGSLKFWPEKAFSPEVEKRTQFNLEALPSNRVDEARMVLKFGDQAWTLYVEDRPVVSMPALLGPTVTVSQAAGELPAESGRKARFQRTDERIVFDDRFLAPTNTENVLPGWEVESGSWALHTAADSSLEREGNRLQDRDAKRLPQPEYSPNFSSLQGKGTNAIITAGHDFYDSYLFEAAVMVTPGEGGLIFHYPEGGGYHAFTVRLREESNRALLSLWRRPAGAGGDRRVLGAVTTELTAEQWVKLRVKTYQNRVQCYMDNVLVLDVATELPAGGRFGLFSNARGGSRFDDVSARSNLDLDFRGLSDIRRQTLVEHGEFFPRRRFFHLFPAREAGDALDVPRAREGQWLIVGSPRDAGHVFSADFETPAEGAGVGLIAGYRGEEAAYLRFTSRVGAGGREQALLESVEQGVPVVLEEASFPVRPAAGAVRPVRLMCDLTNGREVRLYRDGELVLIHHLAGEPGGSSGVFVEGGSRARIANLAYTFEREDLYRNQFEKNRFFVTDPFMRHWSSPEGQWLEERDKTTWYKGDFFGRFLICMPFIPKSEIHLGVGEAGTNGILAVVSRDDKLVLERVGAGGERQAVAEAPAAGLVIERPVTAPDKTQLTERKWFTIHHEGYWVWLTSGETLLLKHRLDEPFKGRRVRIAGFTTEQLKYSYVEQYNVKDHLFTESLHEWTQNGGEWAVVNRFQCQPRWSHMNGESADGLAAIWSKFNFRGDFCAELYAGIRHGWYANAGDLNLTVMSREGAPSRGYTVTCTGWDPDRSQTYTRLYRQGRVVEQTDQYLVPRNREDKKRKGYEPLVQAGRDLHGAWYYMKFRRVGKRMEYYFDNDLALAWNDDEPIPEGTLGVWTFMNSMMVARVKMAAEHVEPRRFAFAVATPEAIAGFEAPADRTAFGRYGDILAEGRPIELTTPDHWETDDPVGRATLAWRAPDGDGPAFVATTTLGSGTMLTRCKLPPVRCRELAGWRFRVKRTANAQFNFHYSVGIIKGDKTFSPKRRFYHRISGDDLSWGAFAMTGMTDVPGIQPGGSDWDRSGEWTAVDVWLPLEDIRELGDPTNLYVRAEGFGNLQPSYVMQGLTGNAPRAAYAVKGFTEVRYGAPRLTFAKDRPGPVSIAFPGGAAGVCTNAAGLQDRVDGMPDGWVRLPIDVTRVEGVSRHELSWIRLPASPGLRCEWDRACPATVALVSDADYPDPRFAAAELQIGGRAVRLSSAVRGRRLGAVPREEAFGLAAMPVVALTVRVGGESRAFSLAWKDCPTPERPVLLNVEGLTGWLENFERRELPQSLTLDTQRMELRSFDAEQGSYLEVGNRGAPGRLQSTFSTPVNLARSPLMQFRYRGSGMVNVSLMLRHAYGVQVSERNPAAQKVRGTDGLTLDGRWHSWLGLVADALREQPLDRKMMDAWNVSLGSRASVDQTGLHTTWDLDDLAFGPAVSSADALGFAPRYFDFAGVEAVRVAVRAGREAFDALEEKDRAGLVWKESAHLQKVAPDLAGVPDGICHLFIKARNAAGRESAVTDIPFLLDREPLKATDSMQPSDDPLHNGTVLRVNFATAGGAPLDLARLELKWNDEKVPLDGMGSKYQRQGERETLILNWPYLFREKLNQVGNGDPVKLVLSSIRDGAGNASPDLVVPLTMDFGRDSVPPTLLATEYPRNILWCTGWESGVKTAVSFQSNGALSLRQKPGKESYLRITEKGRGDTWTSLAQAQWLIGKYPYLAFRLRRPAMRKGDETRISLDLEFGKGKGKHSIALTEPENKEQLTLSPPIAWQSNAWHGVTLDLPSILASRLTRKDMDEAPLEVVRLRQQKGDKETILDVQSVFVFAPWKAEDKVKVNAFDSSGIDGITWAYEDTTENMSVSPVSLLSESRGNRWIMMRAQDRAGNLSAPIRVPVADLKD